ncbi:uncharacterized protein LOC133194942 [Saccostrea echinata]|uniref:uncharacterized protein LOC133194942 n=1 Tax=Saccostrea echinata TaxID=191078 RepID=UPI002A7FAE9F|nr:uncharacterized protein LOC133194942 [Saccostrea echinata]
MAEKRKADTSFSSNDASGHLAKPIQLLDSHNGKDNSSRPTDSSVPLHTSLWTKAFIDRLGVRIVYEQSPENIVKEWSLSVLSEKYLDDIETMLPNVDSCLKHLDFDSLEDILIAIRSDRLPVDLLKIIKLNTDFQYPGSHFASFRARGEDFLFTLLYIINDIEEDVMDWQYQILFDKFLKMFGFTVIQQPFMKTKKSQIMRTTVDSQSSLLCYTSDPRRQRPVVVVCEVNNNEISDETAGNHSPSMKKQKSSVSINPILPHVISDSLMAKHVGELFLHFDESVSPRAVLGMTVQRTVVHITLLHAQEDTLQKIRNAGSEGCVFYDEQEKRARFYYSKPLNYLKRDDRRELVRSLLHIILMQQRFEQ